ncbi:DUF4105 domain-containing protein [Wenyingzhuangia sp. 2_MG-2023]|uniref:Lnb N-terminal periplasmic domain-containing protein n=1 Tax=Wenyingzhuangia sp. 2_MG-2023 TaxID=3062639 RepID=UPI0026E417F6|nr:DUF4105 domain-containing protein [Wenyingzhuangia sp. 2_MG-2023]MDO6738899.1 DUF4105 domain-containing protein [Wenyingzhuangia sp. 2_MG-2023]
MKSISVLFFFFTLSFFSQTNIQLSKNAEISILTCAPGQNELYSHFGHSAMRVKDKENHLDRVYNYGTFDFNTPNFYLKFCRGELLYQVSSYDYKYFPYTYYNENRWVKSQIINLTPEENQKVFDFLEWNALPENKKYYYDFFYDNCANKMYEVIEKSVGNIDFDYSNFPKNLSHRDLIHRYLAKNTWGKFGIDLALGAVIDKKATLKQYMFLPDFVNIAMHTSTLNGKKVVRKETYILPDYQLKIPTTNFFISPLFLGLLLLSISLFLILKNKNINRWFHTLTFIYGITGLIIFSLWFLTEHSTTKLNFNILWANPLFLAYPFLKAEWKQKLSMLGLVFIGIFLVIAATGFQVFNLPIYVFVAGLFVLFLKSSIQK